MNPQKHLGPFQLLATCEADGFLILDKAFQNFDVYHWDPLSTLDLFISDGTKLIGPCSQLYLGIPYICCLGSPRQHGGMSLGFPLDNSKLTPLQMSCLRKSPREVPLWTSDHHPIVLHASIDFLSLIAVLTFSCKTVVSVAFLGVLLNLELLCRCSNHPLDLSEGHYLGPDLCYLSALITPFYFL